MKTFPPPRSPDPTLSQDSGHLSTRPRVLQLPYLSRVSPEFVPRFRRSHACRQRVSNAVLDVSAYVNRISGLLGILLLGTSSAHECHIEHGWKAGAPGGRNVDAKTPDTQCALLPALAIPGHASAFGPQSSSFREPSTPCLAPPLPSTHTRKSSNARLKPQRASFLICFSFAAMRAACPSR